MVPIILAWFVAPLLGGCASAIIFFVCRTSVLRWPNAYQRSYWVLPPIVTVTAFINIFFVFTKGEHRRQFCCIFYCCSTVLFHWPSRKRRSSLCAHRCSGVPFCLPPVASHIDYSAGRRLMTCLPSLFSC